MRRQLICGLALLFVAFTATPALAMIHAGDELSIRVYNHPELTRTLVVDATGAISFPLVGSVSVRGLEPGEIAQRLTTGLRPYVVHPAVDVELLHQGQSIFVSGGPGGVLKYVPGETLSAALSDALHLDTGGGARMTTGVELSKADSMGDNPVASSRIDLRRVGVERDGASLGTFDAIALATRGESGPALQPGDTIVFAYKPVVVRVLGAVPSPGYTYLSSDQTLSEALGQAGGTLPSAATTHVRVTRDGTTSQVPLGDAMFEQPAHTGDVITVMQAPRVVVAGTVTTPGPYTLKTDFSLVSALYSAGGPTKQANLRDVQIVRSGKVVAYDITQLTHGNLTQNPELQDGDLVVVPEGHKIDFRSTFDAIVAALAFKIF